MYPGQVTRVSSVTLASAATIPASYDVIYLTGAVDIATIQPRQLMGDQVLYLIPVTGALGLLNTGNIIAAQTMLQNRVTTLIYSRARNKWYPQALA